MDNKALVKRFYEAVSAGNLSVIDELADENMIEHEEFPGLSGGREGVKQFFQMMHAAFSDLTMTIEDIAAEGDKVFVRATMSGTQKGEFAGIPSKGKTMKVPFADILRFKDGKVVEHWGVTDTGAMMQQLS